MTKGPVLSCYDCDEREDVSGGETICNAAHRTLDDTGITPDWCPFRAQAIAALTPRPKAWDAPPYRRIDGPGGGRPLVSYDYDEADPDD